MDKIIIGFKNYCRKRNWEFDEFTSEFTFQFRICRYLESINPEYIIELESSVERYNLCSFIKKEIDIDILNSDKKRTAIELKFVRDKGSFNIGMFKYCEDIRFLEQLRKNGFSEGYAILFTTIKELYTKPTKLSPKNLENLQLYKCFRVDQKLHGHIQIRTGNLNQGIMLEGHYNLNWISFSDNIMACLVKV